MKVTHVKIENIKKLREVDLPINGHSVTVSGANGVGKSTFIDSVWNTLKAKEIPGKSITLGEKKGYIEITFTDNEGRETIARRDYREKDDGESKRLNVYPAGSKKAINAPQDYLDQLFDTFSIDPARFIDLKPADQKQFLLDFAGLDFSEIEKEKELAAENKRETERQLKVYTQELETMERDPGEAYSEDKDIAEIMQRNEQVTKIANDASNLDKSITANKQIIQYNEAEIEALEDKIAKYKKKNEELQEENTKYETSLAKRKEYLAANPVEDTEKQVAEIKEHNRLVAIRKRRLDLKAKIKTTDDELEKYKEQIKDVEKSRRAVLENTTFPVEGLTFDDNGVLYNGLPMTRSQLSSAQVIAIGAKIQRAANPHLKIIRLKEASMMDEKTLTEVKSMLKEDDWQIFTEIVTNDSKIGFEIEVN